MPYIKLSFTLLLISFIILPLPAQTLNKQDKILLKAARTASNAAFATHNLEGIAQHFITDVIVTSGNGTVFVGRDAVIRVLKERFAQMPDLVYVRTPNTFKISKKEAMAWEEGTWIARRSQTKDFQPTGGKYAAMWLKENGVWKIRSELFVTLH